MFHRFVRIALPCTALLAAAAPMTAPAATITGSVGEVVAFEIYTLEDTNGRASDDWVVYGGYGAVGTPAATHRTTKLENSSFGAMTFAGRSQTAHNVNGVLKLAHDGGFGDYAAPTSTYSNPDISLAVAESPTQATLTFTHTLLDGEEELNIYLYGKAAAQLSVDIAAVLDSGGSYIAEDFALPTRRTSGGGQGSYGILTLAIAGAQAGDVLTFTLSTDYSEEIDSALTPANHWGVGIAAATVTVIPEPASLALLGLGAMLMLSRRQG